MKRLQSAMKILIVALNTDGLGLEENTRYNYSYIGPEPVGLVGTLESWNQKICDSNASKSVRLAES